MTFWTLTGIALLIALALITSKDAYYVQQSNDAFGLVIGTVTITLMALRLFGLI